MKLLTFSLAALMAMGTVSFASDTLADAFKNGTFKGELKAYYYDREVGTGAVEGDIITLGAKLDYETADFYGFKAGLGIQTSNTPWIDEDGKGTFKGDMWGSGAVLSEAYLSYTMNKTTVKAGRQYIKMPLLKSSGSRLIVQSFEGASVVSKDIQNTTLMAAYVNKFQNRTDGAGDIADFETLGANVDYAYALAVENTSVKGLKLTAAYGEKDNSYDMFYAEAAYKGKADALRYSAAAQYSATDYENATADADYYGLKVGAGMGGLSGYIAYAEVQDGTAKFSVAGGGAKPTIFTTPLIDAGEYKESEQYAVALEYNFKDLGLILDTRYTNVDYATGTDEGEWMLFRARYAFKGALKGLSMAAMYEDEDHDIDTQDEKNFWFKTSYKF